MKSTHKITVQRRSSAKADVEAPFGIQVSDIDNTNVQVTISTETGKFTV